MNQHHHQSRGILFLMPMITSGLIILSLSLSSGPAIAQQPQQQQQQQQLLHAAANGGSQAVLAAKILNNNKPYIPDQQQSSSSSSSSSSNSNSRDAVVSNHLTSISGSQYQSGAGVGGQSRDNTNNQPKIPTGNDYMKAANQLLLDLRQQFIDKSIKFDEHFRNLLSTSKRGLHLMFTNTYGVMYERNTEIFTEMYESLEQYYLSGQVNLTKSMDAFFANLYKRVFTVFNSSKQFDKQYLECVSRSFNDMKPFKDVPDKLIKSTRYTFVAARTFLRSLNEGIDVIKNIISLGQSPQCTSLINDKLIKNQQALAGNRQPPCLSFCEQVMARCIGKENLDQINDKWRAYVSSLSDLAHKLSTSYNIVTIIEPLDVQISEAIMNFQENATNITNQIYKICGGPGGWQPTMLDQPFGRSGGQLGRSPVNRLARRSANPMDYHKKSQAQRQTSLGDNFRITGFENLAHEINHRTLQHGLTKPDLKSSNLIDEIKKFASSSKIFWSSLPNSVCTSVLGVNSSTTNSGPGLQHRKQQSNCYSEHFSITDINSDIRYKMEISKQASYLEEVRNKIDEALAGIEVNWTGQDFQHQAQQQQKFATVSNQLSGLSRPVPQLTPILTSTTTTVDPDLTDGVDSEPEPDPFGEGSGCGDGSDPEECESDIEPDTTEMTPDYPESPTKPPFGTTTTTDGFDDNGIDKIKGQPDGSNTNEIFIVAPGYQKSGQTSYKLVISSGSQIVLSFILSVALLFVTNFTSKTRLITQQAH